MKATIGRVENCQDRQATPRYTLRLARTREEVEAATPCVCTSKSSIWNSKRDLRNLFTGIDEDEFDGVCEHLIVREAAGGCPRTKDRQNRCVAPCFLQDSPRVACPRKQLQGATFPLGPK